MVDDVDHIIFDLTLLSIGVLFFVSSNYKFILAYLKLYELYKKIATNLIISKFLPLRILFLIFPNLSKPVEEFLPEKKPEPPKKQKFHTWRFVLGILLIVAIASNTLTFKESCEFQNYRLGLSLDMYSSETKKVECKCIGIKKQVTIPSYGFMIMDIPMNENLINDMPSNRLNYKDLYKDLFNNSHDYKQTICTGLNLSASKFNLLLSSKNPN